MIRPYLAKHASIKYVVLVGGDDVIPQYRVPDATTLCNERAYAAGSYLTSSSPQLAAMLDAMVLTDDFYVDSQPTSYNGHALYIPDISVSRLVETPEEIAAQIRQFLDRDGILSGGSSVVTGQDFMTDGATRVRDILAAAGLQPNADADPTKDYLRSWAADDVRRDLLGGPADVGAVNAHFTHFGGISAAGYSAAKNGQSWAGEFLSSTDISGAGLFVGKLVVSMGCHAGLNVPDDRVALAVEPSSAVDPRLDIAQAMARKQGVLIGSTGYGFGDTEAISCTEALAGNFADEATSWEAPGASQGQAIGSALAAAKRQYLGSLSSVTPYDEKSSVEFTMYGMPQYRLACTTHAPSQGFQAGGISPQGAAFDFDTIPATGFTLTVSDQGTDTEYGATLKEANPDSAARYVVAYRTVNGVTSGDAEATLGTPIQPRVVIDLGLAGSNPVKAAIVSGGSYVDYSGFDPAISTVTGGWSGDIPELQIAPDGWWPTSPVTVSTINTPDGVEQRLIVLPGQFLATSAAGQPVVGTERLWSDLQVTLVRGAPADTLAPSVRSVSLTKVGDTVSAQVDASDDSGIARIDVTQFGVADAAHFTFTDADWTIGPGGTYDFSFDLPGVPAGEVRMTVEVRDGAGNINTVTDKGAAVTEPVVLDTTPPTTVDDADGAWHAAPVTVHFDAVDENGGSGVDYTEYRKDAGSWVTGTSVAVSGDGLHTVAYRSVDKAGNAENLRMCAVRIDGSSPSAIPLLTSPTHPVQWNGYVNDSPSFVWSAATDVISGVAGYSFVLDQVADTTPDTTVEELGTNAAFVGKAAGTWYFHVRAVDNAGNGGSTANYTVTIVAPVAPTLSGPNGGEYWAIGSSHDIIWTGATGDNVTMELSRDGAITWETVDASAPNTGSYSWTVIGAATNRARIRVTDAHGFSDASDADFTIAMFTANADYGVGSDPRSVAVGDFNGDGRQDLVAANYGGSSVSVLLGTGSGTFATEIDYTTGASPRCVAVGDFNGDGKQDIVTGNGHGYPYDMSVLLGNGDGTFSTNVDYTTDGPAYCIAVATLFGDGKQDVVVGCNGAQVSVLPGDGTGAFPSHVPYTTADTPTGGHRRLRRRWQDGLGDGQPADQQRERSVGERHRHLRGQD